MSDSRITSDGKQVVYVEEFYDRSRRMPLANLKLISADGRETRSLTDGQWRDWSPRWSPDGTRLAWISDRGGAARIWVAPSDSWQASAITPPGPVPATLAWAPDGRSIAYTTASGQISVIPAGGGEARQLSTGAWEFPDEPAWMPDGKTLICAERGGELFAVRTADGPAVQLTRTGDINRDPVPSPDGARIAYTAATSKPHFYAVRKLVVMNADGSRARMLGGTLDRDVRHPQWSNDSRTVYFLADDRGATHVYLSRNDGTVRQLTDRAERLQGFSLADNGRAVTVRSSATEGSAVFTFMTDVPAGGWTLMDVNRQLLAERDWGAVEEMPFESGGKRMQAWLVKPAQFDGARKYPLLVDLDDTPPRMVGLEFPLRAHIFAARGFVVLLVNPRGTPGYGEEFGDLLPTEVPGGPADDVMRAVDAAIAKGSIDPKRLTLSGGVVAAWLLGHTDRFARAVMRHTIADWATYPDAARWIRDRELYKTRSPIRFAENFKTPALVIAGEPDAQSGLLFDALQKRKVESSLVRPEPGPAGLVRELEATIAWLVQ